MLEEPARVISVYGLHAEVETRTQVGCERCAAGRGCGAGTLAQAFASSTQENVTVRLAESIADITKTGDVVMVGMDERAVVSGSLALYLAPLLTMIAAAIAATALLGSEPFTIIAAASGLMLGLLWVRHFSLKAGSNPRYEPVAIRQLPADAWYGCEPKSAEQTITA